MLTIIILGIFVTSFCNGFMLRDSEANNHTGDAQYYVQLISSLQNMVLLLQTEMKLVNNQLSTMQQSNGNITADEFNHYKSMALNLNQTVKNLQNEISTCRNETAVLTDHLDMLKESTTTNITLLKTKMDFTDTQVQLMNSTSSACCDTVKNIQNHTTDVESEISDLKKQTQQLDTEYKQMSSDLQHLSNVQNNTALQINTMLYNTSTSTPNVMLRACFDGTPGRYDQIVRFTHIRSSNGINDLDGVRNSGKFTCESDGLYLFSVHIVSAFGDDITIHYNNAVLSNLKFTSHRYGNSYFGKDLMIVNLHRGDVLYAELEYSSHIIPNSGNCMTVIKLV